MNCRHCQKHMNKRQRPAGLCWKCYYVPEIKALYPPTSKFACRGHGNVTAEPPLADGPTMARPGSPEKLEAMRQRAATGRAIFHPGDVRAG